MKRSNVLSPEEMDYTNDIEDLEKVKLTREEIVKEFHNKAGIEYKTILALIEWRIKMLNEEVCEVFHDLGKYANDQSPERKTALLKELCDLQYVLSGTVVALEMEDVFDEAFERVHKSNMAKVEGETTIDENGKIMKPIGWKAPVLDDLVNE